MTTKFEIGKTYQTRSIGDADCIIKATIVSRTAKTVTAKTDQGTKTFRVGEYEGNETFKPYGAYSMCPVINSSKLS